MLLKTVKVLLILLSVTSIYLSAAIRQPRQLAHDETEVKGSAFYTIHGVKVVSGCQEQAKVIRSFEGFCCIASGRGDLELKRHYARSRCPFHDLLDHRMLTATFYNENWELLAVKDLSTLGMQQAVGMSEHRSQLGYLVTGLDQNEYVKLRDDELVKLHKYCRAHLDQSVRPVAKYVCIRKPWGFNGDYILTFHDTNDNEIGKFRSPIIPNFSGSTKYDFDNYINQNLADDMVIIIDDTCCNIL